MFHVVICIQGGCPKTKKGTTASCTYSCCYLILNAQNFQLQNIMENVIFSGFVLQEAHFLDYALTSSEVQLFPCVLHLNPMFISAATVLRPHSVHFKGSMSH